MSDSKAVRITEELIREGMSDNGGWNRKQFAILGVEWPPRNGWKHAVVGKVISPADAEEFVRLRKRFGKRESEPRGEEKPQPKLMKAGCIIAGCDQEMIEAEARSAGLVLVVTAPKGKSHRPTYHWMFNLPNGRRILDYWPASGTVCILGGEYRKGSDGASGPDHALELAKEAAESVQGAVT